MGVEERACRRCGMPLVFVRGPNGKVLPLQRVRKVYALPEDQAQEDPAAEVELYGQHVAVSHFETCPNAGEFSRRGRR